MSVSISVAVRLRPLSAAEAARGERAVWQHSATSIVERPVDDADALPSPSRRAGVSQSQYSFASVVGPSCTTTALYKSFVKRSIDECCRGFNSCVFAFGETASGKTRAL